MIINFLIIIQENYGIRIISKMGQFTKVIITMPRITAMGEKLDEKGIDC